jgi:hypothetical protein
VVFFQLATFGEHPQQSLSIVFSMLIGFATVLISLKYLGNRRNQRRIPLKVSSGTCA